MHRLCWIAVFAGLIGPLAVADDSSVDLRYRSYRKWKIQLPAFQWFEVRDAIRLGAADTFAVSVLGNSLRIDTDADGKLDRTIKPLVDRDTNVSTARVILSATTKQGGAFRYAVRLRKDARGWEWAPGGAMVGTIPADTGPIPVRIIDQNGNGAFDDVGRDAMIVGTSDEAMFLSNTIVVGNTLKTISVARDGRRITMTDHTGPTTRFDMTTSFAAKAVLLSAIVRSRDGRNSFDFGAFVGPVEIPAGTYEVVAGSVGLGEHRVQIGAGRMKPLRLAANQAQTFNWGGPVRSEFQFARKGGKVEFSPQTIWYYGQAGEEYFNWTPIGKSPEFKVTNADTGVVLKVAILPGSC